MENTQEYPIHPLAFLSPDRTPEEQALLVESISQLGQVVPITRWRGQIVDGRHRLYACQKLGIEPRFEHLPDDADVLGHVMARQVLGRHMSDSQMAAYVAELCLWSTPGRPRADDENSAEMPSLTQDQAAKLGRVSTRLVGYAKQVVSPASTAIPELRQALRQGQVNAIDACRVLSEPPEVQQKALDLVINGKARTISRAVRQVKQATDQPKDAEQPPSTQIRLIRDAVTLHSVPVEDLHAIVPEASVDAIITKVHQDKDLFASCKKLSAFAVHALKDGGVLVVVGLSQDLPVLVNGLFTSSLGFVDELGIALDGPPIQLQGLRHDISISQLPALVFGKKSFRPLGLNNQINIPEPGLLPPGLNRTGAAFEELTDIFTRPGQKVCNPAMWGEHWSALAAWKADVTFVGADALETRIAAIWNKLDEAAATTGRGRSFRR